MNAHDGLELLNDGVDGWVSSDLHMLSEKAENVKQMKAVYSAWAQSYDTEMKQNNLKSYFEVTKRAISFLKRKRLVTKGAFRAVDVGCGTGFCGSFFKKSLNAHPSLDAYADNLFLLGIDLVPAMLEIAKKKKSFDKLIQVNLKTDVLYVPDSTFDLMMSSGCFYPGHLGPDVLPNILRKLKPNGAFIFTVRRSMFEKEEEDFIRFISGSNCMITSKNLTPYYGKILAYTITVCKCDDVPATVRAKGFAKLPIIADQSDINDLLKYMKSRIRRKHPGNVYDSRGLIRAVHGYEQGLASNLVSGLAAIAKTITKKEKLYLYQFRMNNKQPAFASNAGAWKTHRDFDFWQGMDGMQCSQSVIVFHILVTDNSPANGAVYLCEGSHNEKAIPDTSEGQSWKDGFKEELKYTISDSKVETWPQHTPMVGKAGDIFAMHSLTW
eukprot:CAMPEP_0184056610 /NCGR_PEP_ID=MMETSP0956-20121227/7895_1 /TAXON_ID=627963 /ORGANISM="Aplanochytrium sp, Strain PBS07" /LENGTH=437 /DNA_ID=CAMNT_0026350699 /DNA_START=110 /DNA_END=1420 /DNA_ORIENTATION=-